MGNGVNKSGHNNGYHISGYSRTSATISKNDDSNTVKLAGKMDTAWKNDKAKMSAKRFEALLSELRVTKQKLQDKDYEVEKLKGEIHKLKSILDAKIHKDGKPEIYATIKDNGESGVQRVKKQGVSGESTSTNGGTNQLMKHYEKDFK